MFQNFLAEAPIHISKICGKLKFKTLVLNKNWLAQT